MPSLPLLLDVLLVGRTKMLRLHSCLWLENNTGMRLEPFSALSCCLCHSCFWSNHTQVKCQFLKRALFA